jgi:hypothetical protein
MVLTEKRLSVATGAVTHLVIPIYTSHKILSYLQGT